MLTIGIYPRKSVYQDNSDSVQVQIQLCQDYAGIIYKDDEFEFKIYDKDEGFSGKNTNRPSFRQMMQDVEDNLLDVVMVYKLDRISRNVQEFSAMYEVFQKHNVSFVSVKESFDTTTPMGRTVMYILAAFAQLERENTSERVADNMLALGTSGKWTGGNCPTGFSSIRQKCGDKEHSYLIIDPDKIWLPKLLYRLLLDGYPITAVERYCRDHGIKSQTGKFLTSSQIHGIITNPVYCQNSPDAWYYFHDAGCRVPDLNLFDGTKRLIGYGKTKTSDSSQPRQNISSWTIAIGIHEPVIPANEWIAAQKRLGINKHIRTAKHKVGLLKGVLKCSCGSRMDIRTYYKNNIQFSYYFCTTMARQGKAICNSEYIRMQKIDEHFLKELGKIKLNPSGFKAFRSIETGRKPESIKSEIRKLDDSIHNLTAALTQAMDTPAASYIINQISDLDKQKNNLDWELRRAVLDSTAAKTAEDAEKEIYNNICYLLDNFDYIDYTGKNELIRKIVKECIFDGQELRIIF